MAAIAVGTMSLVIVLSVFNGLEDFIRSLYQSFDPDVKVMPIKGKTFPADVIDLEGLQNIEGIAYYSQTLEDNAYVKFREAEMIVKLKGVDEKYLLNQKLKKSIVEGDLLLEKSDHPKAIIGRGIQYTLNINDLDDIYPIQLYYPKRSFKGSINQLSSTNRGNINVGGVFAIEKQYDSEYVLVPLNFAERIMDHAGNRSAIEIALTDDADVKEITEKLSAFFGPEFKILDSDEQHSSLVKAIKVEKLFVFLTFSFIIAVAAINIFFALTMLAIEKRKDIAILFSIGANKKLIRSIFIKEGAIISFSGAFLGMTMGIIICFVQMTYGIVPMGVETSIIDAYPVKMELVDFIWSAGSIILITLFFSSRPAYLATRSTLINEL